MLLNRRTAGGAGLILVGWPDEVGAWTPAVFADLRADVEGVLVEPERSEDEILRGLYRGLRERRSPQDVAVDLVQLRAERWLSAVGARDLYGLMRRERAWRSESTGGAADGAVGSSMSTVWRRHLGPTRAYAAATAAMTTVAASVEVPVPVADSADPASLRLWLGWATRLLGLPDEELSPVRPTVRRRPVPVTWFGGTYYRLPKPSGARGDRGGHVDARGRMSAATRGERLPGVSVRAYRRAVRAVLHLQQRTGVLAAERDREAAVAFGKARLAHLVTEDEFLACPATAAFTAYYVARLNMRTRFTSGRQTRPMDSLAEALLEGALTSSTCQPRVLASVVTRWRVLDMLSDAECGELLGRYYEQMAACARALRECFDVNRDPLRMVVRAGDDSSTWNAASRAFNQARTGWLNLTRGLGFDDLVEGACPGKVPALVAADVAAWHAREGHEQHIDVRVWADLPLPWDVVLGDDDCPAELVRQVCRRHGVDPEASGWTQPYRQDLTELPEPAPDLVHGVTVSSPLLASVMRQIGVFSGQA